MPRWFYLVLHVLSLVATGFLGAFCILMAVNMFDTPHNATQENMVWSAGAAVLTVLGVLFTDWVSQRVGQ